MKKSILVTGGAGYIGSVCTEELIYQGYSPIVLDDLSSGHKEAVHPKAKFVRGSVGDKQLLTKVITENSVSSVIHFAGETLVGKANTDPRSYYRNNIVGGLNLLDTMLENNCKEIVFSSSAATYGEPESIPILETHPKNPLNAYGETKLAFERLLKHYSKAYGLNFVVFRYFNAAGASERYGEYHAPETHLIPLVIDAALGKRESITIFGEDYDTPDGTCLRDYVHVKDIANAHILALDNINLNTEFNLGNERGFSVKEIVSLVSKISGKDIKVEMGERRAGDPSSLIADSTKARQQLNWNPDASNIENIVETAWKWASKHFEKKDRL
jgi:UDP-glucose 4-epimerase